MLFYSQKEAIDVNKQKMQKEKLKALETLKDRLIKVISMVYWHHSQP